MRLLTTLAVLTLTLPALAQPSADKKSASIKILVPERVYKPVKLTVEGKELLLGTAGAVQRVIETPPLEVGKTYTYKIVAVIDPNNYTTITRPREVTFKAGEQVTIDMNVEDKVLDKIVVRWVPTPNDIVDEMCKLAKVGKSDIVYDLGCGDAVMLIRPIKLFDAKKGVGIDIDPKMIDQAKDNAKREGVADKVELRVGDILDVKDLPEATVVLLYIGDDLGARLSPVLQKSLKPGARVVSHRFRLGDWKPEQTVTVKGMDGDEYTLHVWIVK